MARIKGISVREGPLWLKLAHLVNRRTIAKLAGRKPDDLLQPHQIAAHQGHILRGVGAFEMGLLWSRKLDFRVKELARARTGMIVGCPW